MQTCLNTSTATVELVPFSGAKCNCFHCRFLFTDNARLASVVGEKSIAAMIMTLSEALEAEYGMLATRLYRVFRPPPGNSHKNIPG